MENNYRIESDLLGDRKVPVEAYYGVHTLRAMENFRITGTTIASHPELIKAMAAVKQAAARANAQLGLLPQEKCDAIVAACEEIRAGALHDQFVLDVLQGGAGTSTNMNANEVICNRALELMGHQRGEYQYLHPNEDVNMAQSTNDVYPTALHVAVLMALENLIDGMEHLRVAFQAKAEEFADVLKIGRTQLQDAVPMTLGQEFATFARMLQEVVVHLRTQPLLLTEINLGGTAIGTGITAHPDYAALSCAALAEVTGMQLHTAPDLIEATQDCDGFVQVSGLLRRSAVKLSKICNDLRLLSSGPRAGMGEINLPPMQAGSSIMPGKVNPVIPEVVNQIAFEVIGNDLTVTLAAEAGQLQLNAFEPVMADSLFRSIRHLANGCRTLADLCVKGITANHDVLHRNVEQSISLATALNPLIGYKAATAVAAEAYARGETVREVVLRHGLMSETELDDALRYDALTQPRIYAKHHALAPEA
ncbi:aspartate ammonia-lyase [Pusillimonas sp. CC-YST705]|uniref:Aspartate ammonia-lyase n=1 Tax=Mesopusillimonas faecipullorum TaxID=2755040 RepID=A0ABS8C9E7_9BURK|nr:aspartate ammonia-lyase [Mesopusillimonas faecipullorum]MCB5362661.1 aspartate ammonia-lyase [Mesopusillimonas faecipullorum]